MRLEKANAVKGVIVRQDRAEKRLLNLQIVGERGCLLVPKGLWLDDLAFLMIRAHSATMRTGSDYKQAQRNTKLVHPQLILHRPVNYGDNPLFELTAAQHKKRVAVATL